MTPHAPARESPHPQGLQGSHLNLSQTSAQRHSTSFPLSNKDRELWRSLPYLTLTGDDPDDTRRTKLTKRASLDAEYVFMYPNQRSRGPRIQLYAAVFRCIPIRCLHAVL